MLMSQSILIRNRIETGDGGDRDYGGDGDDSVGSEGRRDDEGIGVD